MTKKKKKRTQDINQIDHKMQSKPLQNSLVKILINKFLNQNKIKQSILYSVTECQKSFHDNRDGMFEMLENTASVGMTYHDLVLNLTFKLNIFVFFETEYSVGISSENFNINVLLICSAKLKFLYFLS